MQDAYPTQDGEVLRKAEASKLLGISTRTLDDWQRRRIVPFSKLPTGAVRFRRSQLLAFLDKYDVTKGGAE
jgi:predicted site-specific integrase-resolvase